MKWKSAICWLVGHKAILVGKCSQTKPHHCTKQQVWCRRCRRLSFDDGSWRIATTTDWGKRKLAEWADE